MSATPPKVPETQAPQDAQSHAASASHNAGEAPRQQPVLPREIGGRDGPEPTRFGDWEKGGRCIDF